MKVVIDASYFIEFIQSPFETKFQWILDGKLITTSLFAYEFHNVLLKTLKISSEYLYKYHDILCGLTIEARSITGYEKKYIISQPNISFLSMVHPTCGCL